VLEGVRAPGSVVVLVTEELGQLRVLRAGEKIHIWADVGGSKNRPKKGRIQFPIGVGRCPSGQFVRVHVQDAREMSEADGELRLLDFVEEKCPL